MATSCYKIRRVLDTNYVLYEDFTGVTPATSLNTYAVYAELPPLCQDGVYDMATTANGIWNCSLCGNDKPYMPPLPVDENGFVYFFFREHDYLSADWRNPTYGWNGMPTSYLCKAYVDYGCTKEWEEVKAFSYGEHEGINAVDADLGFNYQILKFNTAMYESEDCCVRFMFEFVNSSGVYVTYYSEAYSINQPDCRNIITLEGNYTKQDCDRYYYGQPSAYVGNLISYRNIVKLYGKLTLQGNDFDRQLNERGEVTASKISKSYQLQGTPIPPFLAKQLSRIFASSEIYIDYGSKIYIYKEGSFAKGITDSNMWRLKAQLTEPKCQLFFGCE